MATQHLEDSHTHTKKEDEEQATIKKKRINFIREILFAIESPWVSQFSLFV